MKKLISTLQVLAAGVLLVAVVSCQYGRTTKIVTKSNNNFEEVKYRGTVVFNQTNDGIEHISPGGYLEYKHNDQSFEAKAHTTGGVYYSFNGDSEINNLNTEQKHLVAEAITNIEKSRAGK